jgi:twitching motility protein PilT
VLVSTARVRECIADKERTKELHDAISKGFTTYGMQSFDQSLMHLVKSGLVTYEEALKNVSNPDDFALRFRGIASSSDGTWDDFEKDGDEGEEQKPEPQAAAAAPAPPAGASGKGGRPQPDKAGKPGAGEDDPGFKIERF